MKARKPTPKLSPLDSRRVMVENIRPVVDGGRYFVKRIVGETIEVTADVFADGHDVVRAAVLFRSRMSSEWQEHPMQALGNDVYAASVEISETGFFEYTVEGWIDRFAGWQSEIARKMEAGYDLQSELLEGSMLLYEASKRAAGKDRDLIKDQADYIGSKAEQHERVDAALKPSLSALIARYPDRSSATSFEPFVPLLVERERAGFGAWYEMFPRSASQVEGKHASFKDCEKRLPYISRLGFDVLYLPPIHPIGKSFRKGPNNSLKAGPQDPGSPWAIGAEEGGHKSVHPQLGTIEDFEHLVQAANKQGIEIALDIAFQTSPDHPYVKEHPEWFRHRPDGTIKYAENPPKKYQDIYPIDFDSDDRDALWNELKEVILFWAERGVRIFRVDNPHTKPIRFWEWLLSETRKAFPDLIYLSEAFTRPKVMQALAKAGFSQSYTYFTWRITKPELTEYFTELTQTDVCEYLRPNLFVNTPDILHEVLQFGGCAAFQMRLVLAATLGATYGIYGPPFELCVNKAIPGTEEYENSEKYQIRYWNLEDPISIKDYIARVNRIRKENPALHSNRSLAFLTTTNDYVICYTKNTPDDSNIILTVVNLDPHHPQEATIQLPLSEFGIDADQTFQAHDLLSGARYLWKGNTCFVRLDPAVSPAQIFRLRRKIRTERDFDYYL